MIIADNIVVFFLNIKYSVGAADRIVQLISLEEFNPIHLYIFPDCTIPFQTIFTTVIKLLATPHVLSSNVCLCSKYVLSIVFVLTMNYVIMANM